MLEWNHLAKDWRPALVVQAGAFWREMPSEASEFDQLLELALLANVGLNRDSASTVHYNLSTSCNAI